jgi:uncharacterized membrane protein
MRNSQLPKLVFLLLAAYAAIHFSFEYPLLPATVASHFDAHGTANGWQTRTAFFEVFVGVSVLAAIIGFGIPKIIGAVPIQLINLPHKQYWLDSGHRTASLEFLSTYFAWFGCAVYLVAILTFDYAIQSNLHPEHRPDVSRLWLVLAGFIGFTILWTVRMFLRFARVPRDSH